MISGTIDVAPFEDLLTELDTFEKTYQTNILDELEWFGQTCRDEMVANHPYQDRTGDLTASIRFETYTRGLILGVLVAAGENLDYAEMVEYGTEHSRPFPFFWPIWYLYFSALENRLQTALDTAIARP